MDEQEIIEIVAERWLSQPSPREVVVSAYYEIGRRILGKLIGVLGRSFSQKEWDALLLMHGTKSRISIHGEGPVNMWDGFRSNNLFSIFAAWEAAVQYLYAHYGDAGPEAEELRKKGTREELKEMMDGVNTFIQTRISELTEQGQAEISQDELKVVDEALSSVMLLILGKNGFRDFVAEFNKNLPPLRRVLNELMIRRGRNQSMPGETPPSLFYPKQDRTIN